MRIQIKTTLLGISFFVCTLTLDAQILNESNKELEVHTAEEFIPVASGIPFSDTRYVEAQGSAYFDLQWENGAVITTSGKAYKDVPVRIDLMANKIHFKAEDGRALVVGTPLREVKYQSNGKTIHFVHGDVLPNKKFGWYQLIVNDSVSLLKSFKKIFEERTSYGGNQIYITTTESYLLFNKGTEFPIKKASDLASVMPSKKAEIEAEIKKTKSLGKEEQLVAMVALMNTLVKQ